MYCIILSFYGVYNSYTFSYSKLLTWVQAGLQWMTSELTFASPFICFCAYLSAILFSCTTGFFIQLDTSAARNIPVSDDWDEWACKAGIFRRATTLTWKKYFLSEGSSSSECTNSTKLTSDSSTWLMVTCYETHLTLLAGLKHPGHLEAQWLKGPTFNPLSDLCFWSWTPAEKRWINLQIK